MIFLKIFDNSWDGISDKRNCYLMITAIQMDINERLMLVFLIIFFKTYFLIWQSEEWRISGI